MPSYLRFQYALAQPESVQAGKLNAYLRYNAKTAFGRSHSFDSISSYEDFARRVPLSDYDSFEPWIKRICNGESNVLTHDPVTHLIPTSGSTGSRKLVPFTCGLQREFSSAIGPWLVDLQRRFPGIIGGPAYWSITPKTKSVDENSRVPIGFDSDTAYLGGTRERLARKVMAVPPDLAESSSLEMFRYRTLLYLLRCRDLRLISVWHPSFLSLLLEALPDYWEKLLTEIQHGDYDSAPRRLRRVNELRAIGPADPAKFWPELRVISCWGDAHAEATAKQLKARFPGVFIQRKGLLATEGVMTIPFSGLQPLALRSHFFEFIDEGGRIHRLHELRHGANYEIILTTGGGLWRYRIQDRVRVNGFLARTPCLAFLGRAGNVSDRFGEKLCEDFVSKAIKEAMGDCAMLKFILLAPDEGKWGCCYTLYIEGEVLREIATRLDSLLRKNPHYDWGRRLGQLDSLRIFRIQAGGYEAFVARECAKGKRLGDVKPCSLSTQAGWSLYFKGDYLPLDLN